MDIDWGMILPRMKSFDQGMWHRSLHPLSQSLVVISIWWFQILMVMPTHGEPTRSGMSWAMPNPQLHQESYQVIYT